MPRFCTGLVDGYPCGFRARPGLRFCFGHSRTPETPFPRCQYLNRTGNPCRATPIHGQDHCFTHSRRNRRAHCPPTPLVPRTRRQKEAARFLESIGCHPL
jgi:hypothetical protein